MPPTSLFLFITPSLLSHSEHSRHTLILAENPPYFRDLTGKQQPPQQQHQHQHHDQDQDQVWLSPTGPIPNQHALVSGSPGVQRAGVLAYPCGALSACSLGGPHDESPPHCVTAPAEKLSERTACVGPVFLAGTRTVLAIPNSLLFPHHCVAHALRIPQICCLQ